MDTAQGLKEKPRFASPVARGGQIEGKVEKKQVQKEEMIKKARVREEKEGGEGEKEFHTSGKKKEFETGEVFGWNEKSAIKGKGNRSSFMGPKHAKILESDKENQCGKEMKGGKFTKARRKGRVKCVSEGNMGAGDAESRVELKDGGGLAEGREQEGDTVQFVGDKKPIFTGGAACTASVGKESKIKKKDFGVDVQEEKGIKKSRNMRGEGKGADKETERGSSMDTKQKASQGTAAGLGKSRGQSSIKNKEPQCISSLLSDSQYSEIFDSVLGSSLEHCLVDAQAVLSEVESLQASISQSCESAIGGDREGEHESSQSCRSRQCTGQGKKRKLQENRLEAMREETSGQQTKECKQEDKNSSCGADEYDMWAQCSRNSCKKWRKLEWDVDLSLLPPDWVCSQNTDPHHNSCECPQEDCSDSEEGLVLSSLVPGSMVWAQQPGFPWWPAMIEIDPDSESFILFKDRKDTSPSKYHVTYFGEPVSHAWVSACRVQAFHAVSEEAASSTVKQQRYKKMFSESLSMSRQAEKLPLKKRLAQFGFLSRFNKDWKFSAENDSTERSDEFSCDEEDYAVTCKKRRKKGAKPEAKNSIPKELGEKEKGKEGDKKKVRNTGEKKKVMNTLFTGPKEKKAPSKPEASAGELGAGEGKVLTPSFTRPKIHTNKQALQVEKPRLKVGEQTVPCITACRGAERGQGERERALGSSGEDRKAGKIKVKEDGVRRDEKKEGSGVERKRKIQQEWKGEGRVTDEHAGGSAGETAMTEECEGEEPEKECMKKTEDSHAVGDPPGFLEDDIEILNCQQQFFKDEEEEVEEDFHLMRFKGVRVAYLPD